MATFYFSDHLVCPCLLALLAVSHCGIRSTHGAPWETSSTQCDGPWKITFVPKNYPFIVWDVWACISHYSHSTRFGEFEVLMNPGLDALSNALTAERNARIEVPCHDTKSGMSGDPGSVVLDLAMRFPLISLQLCIVARGLMRIPGYMETNSRSLKTFHNFHDIISHTCDHSRHSFGSRNRCGRRMHQARTKLRNPRSKIVKHRISMNIIQHHPGDLPAWFYMLMYFIILMYFVYFVR